ncbi:MAG: LemA family protein [Lacipirellulaceae bacterium]
MTPSPLLLVTVPALVLAIWWVAVFNRIVATRQHLRESWADIEVELRRRLDLIPSLVEVVRGYARHESGTLESVTRLRNESTRPETARRRGEDERQVEQAAHRLLAVAEAYPDLKADQHFLGLQQELTETEDRIGAARRFYNANVRDLNLLRERFPTNLVASVHNVQRAEYFQSDADARGEAPRVDLGGI